MNNIYTVFHMINNKISSTRIIKNRKERGDVCEQRAAEFLVKHGFSIIYRNYRKPFGEIDIIAEKGSWVHFIEVKSVSHETLEKGIKPEDHVTHEKINKISQTAQYFLDEYELYETRCQIDLITVISSGRNATKDKLVNINYFPNIY